MMDPHEMGGEKVSKDTYTINAAAAACRQWPWTLEVLQGIGKRRLQLAP